MKCNDAEGSRKVSQNIANTDRRKDCGRIFIHTVFVHALECKKYRVFESRGSSAEAKKRGGSTPGIIYSKNWPHIVAMHNVRE